MRVAGGVRGAAGKARWSRSCPGSARLPRAGGARPWRPAPGLRPSSSGVPFSVGWSAVSMMSLMPTGTPANAPRGPAASIACAQRRRLGGVEIVPPRELPAPSRQMRPRAASQAAIALWRPARTAAAISAALGHFGRSGPASSLDPVVVIAFSSVQADPRLSSLARPVWGLLGKPCGQGLLSRRMLVTLVDDSIPFNGMTPAYQPIGGAEKAFASLPAALARQGHVGARGQSEPEQPEFRERKLDSLGWPQAADLRGADRVSQAGAARVHASDPARAFSGLPDRRIISTGHRFTRC